MQKDKRITVKHIREMEAAGMKKLAVEPDFLVGRALAKSVVNTETGEIAANANEEITEAVLKKILDSGVEVIKTLYTNDLDQGPYISQTLRVDETHRRAERAGRDLPHDAPRRAADGETR